MLSRTSHYFIQSTDMIIPAVFYTVVAGTPA